MTNNTVLYLAEGAILKADTSSDWPFLAPLPNYGIAHDTPGTYPRLAPFIGGFNVENLTIGGENGTIDGSGWYWWEKSSFGLHSTYTRPSLFECVGCFDIVMQDVTFAHSSFWTIHPVLSRRVRASRITVLNPITVPNTDGFDPDSTSDVLLEDSYFHVNDDAIAIKAGWDCAGYDLGVPSDNITIRNISVWHGGGGISIGSEMSGGVSNVHVSDVLLQHGSYGIYLKCGVTRGGYITNVTINNVTIYGVQKKSVCLDEYYGYANPFCGDPAPYKPTIVSNIFISNVVSSHSNLSLHLAGIEGYEMTNVWLTNISFDDRTFVDCPGGVRGFAENVQPVPPKECGLEVIEPETRSLV